MMKMRKFLLLCFVSTALSISSCSKSDENESDVVFDAPFYPLKDLNDLDSKVWLFKGTKKVNRKFGYISSQYCAAGNILVYSPSNDDQEYAEFTYYNYEGSGVFCQVDYISKLIISQVNESGVKGVFNRLLSPNGTYESLSNEKTTVSNSKYVTSSQLSKIDIGYQYGMLRIEDKLTKYNGEDKVYLYFKKM